MVLLVYHTGLASRSNFSWKPEASMLSYAISPGLDQRHADRYWTHCETADYHNMVAGGLCYRAGSIAIHTVAAFSGTRHVEVIHV